MLLYSVRHWTTHLLRMKGYFLDLCLHPEVLPRALHRFNFKLLYQLDSSLWCLYNLVCSDQKGQSSLMSEEFG